MKFAITMFVIWFSALIIGANSAEINKVGDTVYYYGEVKQGDADQLRYFLRNGDKLVVNSHGGSFYEGIRIGAHIASIGGISIEVSTQCDSSCANFALAADSIKGTLGFHLAYIEDATEEDQKFVDRANEVFIKNVWANYLTGSEITDIILNSTPSKMVYIDFEG